MIYYLKMCLQNKSYIKLDTAAYFCLWVWGSIWIFLFNQIKIFYWTELNSNTQWRKNVTHILCIIFYWPSFLLYSPKWLVHIIYELHSACHNMKVPFLSKRLNAHGISLKLLILKKGQVVNDVKWPNMSQVPVLFPEFDCIIVNILLKATLHWF